MRGQWWTSPHPYPHSLPLSPYCELLLNSEVPKYPPPPAPFMSIQKICTAARRVSPLSPPPPPPPRLVAIQFAKAISPPHPSTFPAPALLPVPITYSSPPPTPAPIYTHTCITVEAVWRCEWWGGGAPPTPTPHALVCVIILAHLLLPPPTPPHTRALHSCEKRCEKRLVGWRNPHPFHSL